MKPAAERLRERIEKVAFGRPAVPVIQNRDVEAHDDASAIRAALVEQMYSPVRWVETVRYLVAHGATRIIECAPGKVLTGLSKRVAPDADCVAVADSAALAAAIG
jgi:[acyl-carrier-protein] S-malonyltransferase